MYEVLWLGATSDTPGFAANRLLRFVDCLDNDYHDNALMIFQVPSKFCLGSVACICLGFYRPNARRRFACLLHHDHRHAALLLRIDQTLSQPPVLICDSLLSIFFFFFWFL